jgi:hypothetical protein
LSEDEFIKVIVIVTQSYAQYVKEMIFYFSHSLNTRETLLMAEVDALKGAGGI